MISVVIPTLDEERWLPRCLDALGSDAARLGVEVLVVDGGSRDATPHLAVARQGVRLLTCPAGRGRQLNAGARAARGTLLVFLPADTLLPGGALARLAAIDRAGRPAAGGFRQRFDSPRPFLRVVSRLHNFRARVTGVVYGDQVLFVRRELFADLDGYREGVDMEDVEFGSRLRRRTRPRLLDLTVTTSARRFERVGPLRATAEAAGLLACWTLFRRVPGSRTFFAPLR